MQYTDSTWQRRLWESAQDGVSAPGGYWLEPFRTYRSDCPFLVGSHDRVAAVVATHLERGVRTFVLDLLPDELEFENTRRAVELAYAAVSGQRA